MSKLKCQQSNLLPINLLFLQGKLLNYIRYEFVVYCLLNNSDEDFCNN